MFCRKHFSITRLILYVLRWKPFFWFLFFSKKTIRLGWKFEKSSNRNKCLYLFLKFQPDRTNGSRVMTKWLTNWIPWKSIGDCSNDYPDLLTDVTFGGKYWNKIFKTCKRSCSKTFQMTELSFLNIIDVNILYILLI
jgi:hypothetical protein